LYEVSAAGLYDVNNGVEVAHDAATHQLRVARTVPFDEMRASDARGHYETLLRSRL